ncbi:unnamed protein product [Urochloa decumbens]|uniref:AB hydrolase-1 domain-containing protein n=1 Tax=Urochloa decumbens TaxID=240449 RepID=A0ABC9HD96_9POAL
MSRAAVATTTRMAAEEMRRASASAAVAAAEVPAAAPAPAGSRWARVWPPSLRWIPTSTDRIIAAEKRLLSVLKTGYVQEQVNIGSAPPGSKVRWFRSASDEPRFINTVTFDSKENAPTLVMVHGYAASQGFFFRNFDALANRFRVIAIDQLGWGGSSRPDFTCKSTEETEHRSEWLTKFRATWKGMLINHLWESNFTPQRIVRGLGPWGPGLVQKYTSARFGTRSNGELLTDQESALLTDYIYHTLAAKASGELCLKYIFSFGAFARKPLLQCASDWKVPTTFIYGQDDWMNYQGAQQARKDMKVPCEIIRVPQGGHFVFIDNPSGFHSAVLYACRNILSGDGEEGLSLPDGLISA